MTHQPDAPEAFRRSRAAEGGSPRSGAGNRTRTGVWGTLAAVRCSLTVAVCAAVFATVLVPVAVSAHDPEDVTTTEEVDVYNYQTRRVQVAPFSETTTVDVYNYEDQQVRVAPFSEARTIPVFNYRTRRVRVAPLTKTVTSQVYFYEAHRVRVAPFSGPGRVAVFNYENQRVRVAPFSEARTIPVYNYRTVKSGCRPPRGCVYTRVRVAPFSTTVQVDVYNYQTRRVRVAPFTKTGQVPLFNYQTRQVRVAPTHKTETVDVFNYENQKVRVAPFTSTVRMDLFNYETRQVRVAPFTKTVTVDVENYENKKVRVAPFTKTVTKTVTRHDPTQHTCPNGQHMKPLPPLRVVNHGISGHSFTPEQNNDYTITGDYTYTEKSVVYGNDLNSGIRPSSGYPTVPVEWEKTNEHTGCHKPIYPQPKYQTNTKPWGDIGNAIKNAVKQAALAAAIGITNEANGTNDPLAQVHIDSDRTYIEQVRASNEVTAKTLYLVACTPEGVAGAALVMAKFSKNVQNLLKGKGGVAGATVTYTLTKGCPHVPNPFEDKTTTTTTTTTTVPPTTTTEVPPELPP